ncbi:MAG: hypothetical protein U9N54_09190 [candidate division Zixibacteria bacterium]|nr:hypothetical protein [candidate division Zixibacteria bacterium]
MIPFDISQFQPRAWTIISRSFKADRIAGTYLFHGPKGCGDWAFSVSLAALLNCSSPNEISENNILPCGDCYSCRKIFNLTYEYLYTAFPLPPHEKEDKALEFVVQILDEKREHPFKIQTFSKSTTIPIALARSIKKSLSRKADKGIIRVVIFEKMELMKTSSADALLKMIEEPQPNTVIILTSNKPEFLLPTIHSRAQKIKLDRTTPEVLEKYLKAHYEISDIKAKLLSKISEGYPGNAIEFIDHDNDSDSSKRAIGFYLFKSLVNERNYDICAHLNEMLDQRDRSAAANLLIFWQSLIRDCASYLINQNENELINVDFTEEIKKLSTKFNNPQTVLEMAEQIKITLADLRLNVHIQGALTAVALKLKANLEM